MTFPNELFEAGTPSIAEQREIRVHNAPIINALSVAVVQAQRLFGRDSAEHQVACRLFDTASEKAKQQERL
jgi:hypothetical protein